MKTHFAPAERAGDAQLRQHIESLSGDPIVDNLMQVSNGLFAVLNEQRQIVALNDSFLKMMGVENCRDALGLRPGEYIHCVHAHEMPGGCGTTEWCRTCGAVLSIMACHEQDTISENTCVISVEKDGKTADLFLSVRCCPVTLHDTRFILIFLQDISMQQQQAYLERVFFHDINNILQGVIGKSHMLLRNGTPETESRLTELNNIVIRMAQEISLHRSLISSMKNSYQPLYRRTGVTPLLRELEEVFASHPLCATSPLRFEPPPHEIFLITDVNLVERVLSNMIINALEASPEGSAVRVFTEPSGNTISLCVSNDGVIPDDIALRIFQRNFSTKQTIGRGLGTFSMKFFGETVLGGKVGFTSTAEGGTVFRLELLCE